MVLGGGERGCNKRRNRRELITNGRSCSHLYPNSSYFWSHVRPASTAVWTDRCRREILGFFKQIAPLIPRAAGKVIPEEYFCQDFRKAAIFGAKKASFARAAAGQSCADADSILCHPFDAHRFLRASVIGRPVASNMYSVADFPEKQQ
jgi:hypothetical protein